MTCLCGLPVNLTRLPAGHMWICPTCGPRDREQLNTADDETKPSTR